MRLRRDRDITERAIGTDDSATWAHENALALKCICGENAQSA